MHQTINIKVDKVKNKILSKRKNIFKATVFQSINNNRLIVACQV